LFLRRYGECIRDFIEADKLAGELSCEPNWGESPSAELSLPPDLVDLHPPSAGATEAVGAATPAETAPASGPELDAWYGFYPNGREILLAIESVHGDDLGAIYAVGPGLDAEPAHWARRTGRIVDDEFVFEAPGQSTLRFRPRADGGLAATWISPDGRNSMEAGLRRIDSIRFATPDAPDAPAASAPSAQPQ
jgi:hypothetical protein